ncbi:MAG: Gx transporter family protein [Clostridia bacterium]|nr:Gx transporter family protein [Clostridia bacterium]
MSKEHSRAVNVKKLALCGMMTALAIVFGYVEHLIPFPIGIYGIKLGIANIAIVVAIYALGGRTALIISTIRILISTMLFGNGVSLAYSLCGGLLSTLVMMLMKRSSRLSCIGVSVCGGIVHNIAQLAVAVAVVDNLKIAFYLPVLLAAGAITGFLVGSCSLLVLKNAYVRSITDLIRQNNTPN